MSNFIFSIDEKIAAVEVEIRRLRRARREPGSSPAYQQYRALQAVAADLRARQQLPRSNALGALERDLERMKEHAGPTGQYEPGYAMALANTVVGKWSTISQALEQFGEESAE